MYDCMTGQVVFDALGQVDVQGVSVVSDVLTEGLVELGHEQHVSQQQTFNIVIYNYAVLFCSCYFYGLFC